MGAYRPGVIQHRKVYIARTHKTFTAEAAEGFDHFFLHMVRISAARAEVRHSNTQVIVFFKLAFINSNNFFVRHRRLVAEAIIPFAHQEKQRDLPKNGTVPVTAHGYT